MTPVILASQSPTRAALLRGAGVTFTARSPGVDEDALKAGLLAEGAPPRDIADILAETKAVRVSQRAEGLVIGADSTVDLGGVLHPRGTVEHGLRHWAAGAAQQLGDDGAVEDDAAELSHRCRPGRRARW